MPNSVHCFILLIQKYFNFLEILKQCKTDSKMKIQLNILYIIQIDCTKQSNKYTNKNLHKFKLKH